MRRSRPQSECQQAAAEVRFELWALSQSLGDCREALSPAGSPDWAPGAFAVECCLLHVRNVLDFLYPRLRVHADDIVADDFTAGRWSRERPDAAAVQLAGMPLQRVRQRLDKELAHLTYSRVHAREEQLWEHVVSIAEDLLTLARCFLRSLDEPERSWFAANPNDELPWLVASQLDDAG